MLQCLICLLSSLHLHSPPLGDLIAFCSFKYHLYVNDSQIYIYLIFTLIYI